MQLILISWQFQKNLVAPYNILSSLLFSFIAVQAVEFFISVTDAVAESRTTVSLCPFNNSLFSHLFQGFFLFHFIFLYNFPFWFSPNYMSSPPPLFIYFIHVPTLFYSYTGEKIVRFPWTTLSRLSQITGGPTYGKNNQCSRSVFKSLQSPQGCGIAWLCNYRDTYFSAGPSHQDIILFQKIVKYYKNFTNLCFPNKFPPHKQNKLTK